MFEWIPIIQFLKGLLEIAFYGGWLVLFLAFVWVLYKKGIMGLFNDFVEWLANFFAVGNFKKRMDKELFIQEAEKRGITLVPTKKMDFWQKFDERMKGVQGKSK